MESADTCTKKRICREARDLWLAVQRDLQLLANALDIRIVRSPEFKGKSAVPGIDEANALFWRKFVHLRLHELKITQATFIERIGSACDDERTFIVELYIFFDVVENSIAQRTFRHLIHTIN